MTAYQTYVDDVTLKGEATISFGVDGGVSSGVPRGGGGQGGAWPPGASLGGGAGTACRGEF